MPTTSATHIFHAEQSDPQWHPSWAQLEAGLSALPTAPKKIGRLTAIIRRPGPGQREPLQSAHLSVAEGLPGDEWNRRPQKTPEGQLTVMNTPIAELIANGQPITVFGDNLFVDLDLSTQNLPPGTRVQIGDVLLEVTPLPHNGCRKFNGRFGPDAHRLVQASETRSQNYRGIHWKVIQPGEIRIGDTIQVLTRPASEAGASSQ